MYYRIAFVAPVEPLESCTSWLSYETLKLAGHAVEIVDPRLHPGLIDKTGMLNKDMFAPFAARFKPDYITLGDESAQDILDALENEGCGTDQPARHFVVFGFVGKGNFGDELLFTTITERLAERFPNSFVTLIGHDPVYNLAHHGVASIMPRIGSEASVMLNGASALIFFAGVMFDAPHESTSGLIDLFQTPHSEIGGQAAAMMLAYMHGVPVFCLGIGAGPLDNPDAQRLVKIESLTEPRYYPRDKVTCELLAQAGVDDSLISYKADMMFLRDRVSNSGPAMADGHELEPCSYVVVSLRQWSNVSNEFCNIVASALDRVYEQYGLKVVFVDFDPNDATIHGQTADAMTARSYMFGPAKADAQATCELLSKAKICIALRLHCSIIANLNGVPSIGFNYNDKVEGYYERTEAQRFLLPMNCDSDQIIACVDELLADYDASCERVAKTTRSQSALAREGFDEACTVIDSHVPAPTRQHIYPRIVSVEQVALDRARKRIARLEAELAKSRAELSQARDHISELESSTTWKVGKAATVLPRAAKRALRRQPEDGSK